MRDYAAAMATAAVATGLCFGLFPFLELTNLVMVYLLGALAVAARGSRGAAVLYSVLSVLCFDFFFVPPRFTLSVSETEYLITFGAMFATAFLISDQAFRLRVSAEESRRTELRAETERVRSSLLSSISHDLRTPLAAIIGSAGSLLQGSALPSGSPARPLVEDIHEEALRLARLVHNLLEATRLESAVKLKKEAHPIEEVVGSALGRLERELEGREVRAVVPEDLPLVSIDPSLLEQALVNLLENAVRHTPSGTPLEVEAEASAGMMTVSVRDRGPGVPPADLERVFDKFYRAGSSPGGAGLGLAICKAVVAAHGGRIWVENRHGGGAAFRFILPLGGGDARA